MSVCLSVGLCFYVSVCFFNLDKFDPNSNPHHNEVPNPNCNPNLNPYPNPKPKPYQNPYPYSYLTKITSSVVMFLAFVGYIHKHTLEKYLVPLHHSISSFENEF